jgi:hypothetical protein
MIGISLQVAKKKINFRFWCWANSRQTCLCWDKQKTDMNFVITYNSVCTGGVCLLFVPTKFMSVFCLSQHRHVCLLFAQHQNLKFIFFFEWFLISCSSHVAWVRHRHLELAETDGRHTVPSDAMTDLSLIFGSQVPGLPQNHDVVKAWCRKRYKNFRSNLNIIERWYSSYYIEGQIIGFQ